MAEELRIRLMGGPSVDGLTERELGTRKARTLLALLAAARGEIVSVDRAADVLWGDALPARPADQVGVLISRLRGVLGPDHLLRRAPGYALADVWLDVEEIDERVDEAISAQAEGRVAAARAAADAALALVRGVLLPSDEGDWVEVERERVDARLAAARRTRIEATFATGDLGAVVALAESVLVEHPYDEAVLRTLMRAHAGSGSIAAALAVYARARARFVEDLGVSPGVETEQLHTRLLIEPESFRPPAPAAPPAPRLVGRAGELGQLDGLLDRARRGEVVIVTVEGEAGIGKSSLVRSWNAAVAADVFVAAGACDELGRDLPLAPVADALATAARIAGPDALGQLPDGEAWLLAGTLGIGTVVSSPAGGAPGWGQPQLFAAVLHAIEHLAAERTTVLVIEDLHHGVDTSTLAWLNWVPRRARRLMIVVTARPGHPIVPASQLLELGPLDAAAIEEWVGPERAVELQARSGGHPLLLEAIAAATGDGGVPATIRDSVDRELGALGGAAATIRAAAVIAPDVDVDVVAAVEDASVRRVLDDLDAAVTAGLLTETESGYRFRHELIRAAIEASVTSARQAFVHREAARALAGRPRADALAVAIHAQRGGDHPLAARSFAAAAALAAARYDLDRADELLTESFALDPAPSTLVARARLRMSRLDLDGAAADAEGAIAAGAGPAGHEILGWIAYYRRDYSRAGSMAREALAQAGDDADRAGSLALSARVRHGRGDLAGALTQYHEAQAGPPSTRQVTAVWHASALLHAGRPGEALAQIEQGWRAPAAPHPFIPLHARWGHATSLAFLGRTADAFASVDELDRLIDRAGDLGHRFVGPARNVRGYLLRSVGRFAAADESNAAALEHTSGPDALPREDAMVEAYWVARLDLVDGRLVAGDHDEAAGLVAAMGPLDTWSGTMAWHQRHRLDLQRARLALLDGDRDRSLELARAVSTDAWSRGALRYAAIADAIAALAGDPGDPDTLAPTIERLRTTAALEAWRLMAALGAWYGVDEWTRGASTLAATLIDRAGDHRDPLTAEVARLLG